MADLSDNIAVEIFNDELRYSTYVNSANDDDLWTSIGIGPVLLDPSYVLDLLGTVCRIETIKSFSIYCNLTKPVDSILTEIKVHCPGLRKLVLSGQIVSNVRFVLELIQNSRELEELILSDTRALAAGTSGIVYKHDVQSFRKLCIINCGDLLTVSITTFLHVRSLQSLLIEVVPDCASRVQSLVRENANSLRRLLVKGTITGKFLRIICTCEGLQKLSLIADDRILTKNRFPKTVRKLYPDDPTEMPSSADWLNNQMNFPSLNYLEFEGIGTLPDSALIRIANSSPHLQIFSLSRCDQITNKSIEEILLKCSKLTKLEFNDTMGVSMPRLAKFMTIKKKKVELLSNGRSLEPKVHTIVENDPTIIQILVFLAPLIIFFLDRRYNSYRFHDFISTRWKKN